MQPPGFDLKRDLTEICEGSPSGIIDVGANHGQTATKFHSMFPEARILSIEPHPETFRQLESVVSSLPNVRAHHGAVGAERQELELNVMESSEMHSFDNRARNHRLFSGKSIPVQVQTLDDLAKTYQMPEPLLLKTDTEGHDIEVLRGATELLTSGAVTAIFVEVEFVPIEDVHTNIREVADLLREYGYGLYSFHDFFHASNGEMRFCNALFRKL